MPNQPKVYGDPIRRFRVSDELWIAFAQVAEDRGTTPSELIRQSMKRTVDRAKRAARGATDPEGED